jgi:hypothetical protein
MKEKEPDFFNIACGMAIAAIVGIFLLTQCAEVKADEPPKVTDCTPYKGSPADSLYYKCPDMKGEVKLTIYLCGEPMSFVLTCPTPDKGDNKK